MFINENNEDFKILKGEVPYGDKLEDFISQLKEIQSLYKKRKKGEVDYVSFLSKIRKIRESYKSAPDTFWNDDDVPMAKRLKLIDYTNLYRYVNITNPKRIKNRIGRGPLEIPITLPEKKESIAESYIIGIYDNIERKKYNS